MKRTPTIEHDGVEAFRADGRVTKTWTDPETGQRYLTGVVSGTGEDTDGERVSARAIATMAAQPVNGGVIKATASHDQDWLTEFGDVVALKHDREHHELAVDVALPPAGEDPIADKAFKRAQKGDLGWSIGGKLRKSFFEIVPGQVGKAGTPKRRHVLDDIHLAHVCLTRKPSYKPSFARAVAKTAKLDDAPTFGDTDLFDEPDGLETRDAAQILKRATEDLEAAVRKAKTQPAADEEQAPEASAEAAAPAAAANPDENPDVPTPGAGDTSADPATEQRTDAQAASDLPQAEGQRHLACPNCGTEFAAPLPDDLQPGQVAEKEDTPEKPSADPALAKTTNKENTMGATLNDSLVRIRALATGGAPEVTKTPEPEPGPEVAKTDPEGTTEVERLVAAGVRLSVEKTEELGETVAGALADVTKTLQDLRAELAELPQGRRSVAKRGGLGDPPPERTIGDEQETTVEKIADSVTGTDLRKCSQAELQTLPETELIQRADTVADANYLLNKRNRGIQ